MTKFRANLEPAVILKSEEETKSYWIRYEKVFFDKKTAEVRSDFMLNAMSVQDWKQIQKMVARSVMEFPKIAGYDKYVICHNPELVTNLDDLKIK